MRKSFFFSIIALAAVVSCSKSEVIDSKYGNDTIGFQHYVGRDAQTKASVADESALKGTGFGVYGFYTAQNDYATTTKVNLMEDQEVTWDATSSAWTYTPTKYWTNATDKYTFLAYAPINEPALVASQPSTGEGADAVYSSPIVTYTVPAELEDQLDVLYATKNENLTKEEVTKNYEGKVPFTFNHALARLAVTAKAEMYDAETGEIVTTPKDGQEYDFTFDITSITISGKFNKVGALDLYTGNWSYTPATATETTTYTLYTPADGSTGQDLIATAHNFSADANYLMMIPTDFSANNGTETEPNYTNPATLTVNYTVTYAGTTSANTAEIQVTTDFEKGNAYRIDLTLKRDPNNAIVFNVVKIEGWPTENDSSADIVA